MNTPAHAVLELAALERGKASELGVWIVLGAVLPDVPNALFFAWYRGVVGMPSDAIYRELYHLPQWQAVLAPSHSVLLFVAVLLVARWRRHAGATALSYALGLHLVLDLLTHGTDAHPHLYPLSQWRFASAVSYWDASAGARWFVPLELGSVIAASFVAWRRGDERWRRVLLAGTCAYLTLAYALGWSFWGTA